MTGGRQAGQPQLTVEEMAAAVEEAHKRGVPVAAHAESRIGVLNALRAGVDSVEHGHGGDEEAIELMLERGAALVPTILSDRRIIDHGIAAGIPDFVVEQCEALHDSLVVFLEARHPGRGQGRRRAMTAGRPLVPIGDMVGELELYVRHGMTPLQALSSATTVTAAPVRTGGRRARRDRATSRTCSSSIGPDGVHRRASIPDGGDPPGRTGRRGARAYTGAPRPGARMITGSAAMTVGLRATR